MAAAQNFRSYTGNAIRLDQTQAIRRREMCDPCDFNVAWLFIPDGLESVEITLNGAKDKQKMNRVDVRI